MGLIHFLCDFAAVSSNEEANVIYDKLFAKISVCQTSVLSGEPLSFAEVLAANPEWLEQAGQQVENSLGTPVQHREGHFPTSKAALDDSSKV